MIAKSTYLLFLLLFISLNGFSKDYKVADMTEFDKSVKLLKPGDRVIMKNGTWMDVDLRFKAQGSKDKPIFLMAETPGKVILSGMSSLNIAGEFVVINGLWFKNGSTDGKAVISFRLNTREFANNSRITNCAVTNYNPSENTEKYYYMEFWGKSNRLDHSHFEGKTNEGPTVVVWLKGENHRNNNHRIDNNYFGERPPLGRNGGETIRIGTSDNSVYDSCTLVEKNLFEKCNGESEIISNKSGKNHFRYNLFLESQGSLVLRHGDNAIVEKNVFDGRNKKWTGGVRVINEGHLIWNNLFMNLKGEQLKSPFVIMNGVPNSPLNRYRQVKNVDIQFNTFLNCSPLQFGAGSDEERSLVPDKILFANNLFLDIEPKNLFQKHDTLDGIKFINNKIVSKEISKVQGFKSVETHFDQINGISTPTAAPLELGAEVLSQSPETDITDNDRKQLFVGAFQPGNDSLPVALTLKPGTDWMQ